MYHIHFGAGKLGLGLVLPILKNLEVGLAIFQRSSNEWKKLENYEEIELCINSKPHFTMNYITNKTKNVSELIEKGNPLLVNTSNTDAVSIILQNAISISISVGTSGFPDVLHKLQLVSHYSPNTRLYAFENDFAAVKEFSVQVQRCSPNITVVPVMCDRICTSREIIGNKVNVTCEKYQGVAVIFKSLFLNCYPFTTPKSSRRRCIPENVILASSNDEELFYYNRKFSLLNGIHFTMAVFSYTYLVDNSISTSLWLESPLSIWSLVNDNHQKLQLMIEARIILLITQTNPITLEAIFKSNDQFFIFSKLNEYAQTVLERIRATNDTLGRILNLKDTQRVQTKYNQHLAPLTQFFSSSCTLDNLNFLPNSTDTYNNEIQLLNTNFWRVTSYFP